MRDNYREQKCCFNCTHAFQREEHRNPTEWFCTFKAEPRPPCCSIKMGESPWPCDPADITAEQAFLVSIIGGAPQRAWKEWKKDKAIDPFYICDHWEKRTTQPEKRNVSWHIVLNWRDWPNLTRYPP